MLITMEYLEKLDTEAERAQAAAEDANARRNEAVLIMLEAGSRQTDIAVRLNLSPGRVSQIARAARERRTREQRQAA